MTGWPWMRVLAGTRPGGLPTPPRGTSNRMPLNPRPAASKRMWASRERRSAPCTASCLPHLGRLSSSNCAHCRPRQVEPKCRYCAYAVPTRTLYYMVRPLCQDTAAIVVTSPSGMPSRPRARSQLRSWARRAPHLRPGAVWLKEWWRRYDVPLWSQRPDGTFRLDGYDVTQSWDCAFRDTKSSDYVVGQVWAKRGADSLPRLRALATAELHPDPRRRPAPDVDVPSEQAQDHRGKGERGRRRSTRSSHEIPGIVVFEPGRDSKEGRARRPGDRPASTSSRLTSLAAEASIIVPIGRIPLSSVKRQGQQVLAPFQRRINDRYLRR